MTGCKRVYRGVRISTLVQPRICLNAKQVVRPSYYDRIMTAELLDTVAGHSGHVSEHTSEDKEDQKLQKLYVQGGSLHRIRGLLEWHQGPHYI